MVRTDTTSEEQCNGDETCSRDAPQSLVYEQVCETDEALPKHLSVASLPTSRT
jgi:hypothetical protein